MQCPCQSDKAYADCCEPYHIEKATAPTAEILMRARYSAYALSNDKYLHKSWSKLTRPSKKTLRKNQADTWLSLRIVSTCKGMMLDAEGSVEFVARYHAEGKEYTLYETSYFTRENGKWVYLDGNY
ncbi:MAG: YchJ family protein [Leucothrix sp.]